MPPGFPHCHHSGKLSSSALASSSTAAGSKEQGHISCSYTLRFSSAALTPPGSALLFYQWGAEPSIWIAFPFSLTESQLSHLSQVAKGGDETYSSHTLVIHDIWRRGRGSSPTFIPTGMAYLLCCQEDQLYCPSQVKGRRPFLESVVLSTLSLTQPAHAHTMCEWSKGPLA